MRKPKHKNAAEKEPMLHDFDDLDQAPIFTISNTISEIITLSTIILRRMKNSLKFIS